MNLSERRSGESLLVPGEALDEELEPRVVAHDHDALPILGRLNSLDDHLRLGEIERLIELNGTVVTHGVRDEPRGLLRPSRGGREDELGDQVVVSKSIADESRSLSPALLERSIVIREALVLPRRLAVSEEEERLQRRASLSCERRDLNPHALAGTET